MMIRCGPPTSRGLLSHWLLLHGTQNWQVARYVPLPLDDDHLIRFKDGQPVNIPGHSVPLAGLGGFILVFGFLAFNGGSMVRFCLLFGLPFFSFLFYIFLRSSLFNPLILGKHIREGGRRHSGLGNREHYLGRLNWRHCCSPPHQVQVDCQELCKEFLDAVASLAPTPLCLSGDKGDTDIIHLCLFKPDDSLIR